MVGALLMGLVATQALAQPQPDAQPSKMPERPSQVALIYFQQGDLTKAINTVRVGAKTEPKMARQMLLWLLDYGALVRRDEGTAEAVRKTLELDRLISPKKPGKLTEPLLERYINEPLKVAKLRAQASDAEGAAEIAKQVLSLDPKNAEAKSLLRPLRSP